MTRWIAATCLVVATALLAACGGDTGSGEQSTASQERYNWRLVTAWPKGFPGLGTAPERFAQKVEEMSAGRMRIRVYGADELVPALEVFDAVSAGTADIGHSAAYYWKGKVPEAQFFTVLPFGMSSREMDAWVRYGGGQALWEELYAPFNLLPMPGGNTGVQMGGWFNREINSVRDFRGLKMRIPGLAGDVLQRLGGVPVNLPGGELFTSLQTGVIDATEFVGPYNDLSFGFHRVAQYYYYPGWHEPGSMLEFMFNKSRFEALPADLQAIMRTAAAAVHVEMVDEFTASNSAALKELLESHGVDLRRFPDDLLIELRDVSQQAIDELAQLSEVGARIHASYRDFEEMVQKNREISDEAYDQARKL